MLGAAGVARIDVQSYYPDSAWNALGPARRRALERAVALVDENLHENFKVLRLIFVIAIVFGFQDLLVALVDGVRTFDWPLILGAVVTILVALRFVWALGNLRRYLRPRIVRNLEGNIDADGKLLAELHQAALTRAEWTRAVAFDVPVILLHSFLIFMLCGVLPEAALQVEGASAPSVTYLTWLLASLLLVNVIWLATLTRANVCPRARPRPAGAAVAAAEDASAEAVRDGPAELTWLWNNLVCGLLLVALALASWLGALDALAAYLGALAVVGVNSAIDYRGAGWVYIVGDPG
jgi:hypothetical protein